MPLISVPGVIQCLAFAEQQVINMLCKIVMAALWDQVHHKCRSGYDKSALRPESSAVANSRVVLYVDLKGIMALACLRFQ